MLISIITYSTKNMFQLLDNGKIDEGLYSRQLYAVGFDAMKKMSNSSVLIYGMSSLGVEIAKNTILQGFKQVTIFDNEIVSLFDLGTNYYLTESDIGKNRASVVINKLSELNNYVKVDQLNEQVKEVIINKIYNIVVIVDQLQDFCIEINKLCRESNTHFILCQTNGLVGRIFCDFGEKFLINDQDGEQLHTSIIENIQNDVSPLVTCVDSKPHNLTSGDLVKFNNISGMIELNNMEPIEIQYIDKFSFKLKLDTSKFGKYTGGGEFVQCKKSKELNFKSLEESLKVPEFVMTDFTDFDKPLKLHTMYDVFNKNTKDINDFKKNVLEINNNLSDDLMNKFYETYKGKLTPINSIIGGIASQEVFKACTSKFSPIYQWLYFDAFDCLPDNFLQIDKSILGTRYDSQITIFGKDFQQKLADMKYFIVGSGAIGCELLKNFAMIGLASGPSGKIYITDMDTIEKSNLNRQFLFRNTNIGKSKSETAKNAIKNMNPDVNIEAHLNKMGPETETLYNSTFFEQLDGVANALDNIDARKYVDRRCVLFKKSLLESGTLGTKGNVQVVVPHLTESYSSSMDPPETSIPICTIKTFPNSIDHVVAWSREQFEEMFNQYPKYAIEYIKNPDKTKAMNITDLLSFHTGVKFVLDNAPKSFDDCIQFAFNKWHEYYVNQIDELLYKFPKDMITSTGTPFWTGSKKCPNPAKFDVNNKLHLDYVISFSNLWANLFGILPNNNISYIISVVDKLPTPKKTINKDTKISVNDEEEKKRLEELSKSVDVEYLLSSLPEYSKIKDINLTFHEFEKDDDSNFHIDFITAASNMRASNYNIEVATRHTIKGIAGKIIPALATTTAVVAGLVTLELYKLAQGFTKVENYKNSFLNLALPYFGFSEPICCKKATFNHKTYSMWDTFLIKKSMTLQEFLDLFKDKFSIEIDTITFGNFMLYSMILNKNKLKERLNTKIEDIIQKELDHKLDTGNIILQICVFGDDDDDDIELPDVLYSV